MKPEVLVLDDERTNARLIKMLLDIDGFETVVCHNLTEAHQQINPKIAACVLDFHLSGEESGLDFLLAIRSQKTSAAPQTPIVVTTGDYRQAEVALDAGADLFMLKPYPPSELANALRTLLNSGAVSSEEE